jgi:3-oxoacyl-[acyl-carrier protein] reductase
MSDSQKSLAGKTAVVTGAGRGIGHSIAIMFARAGAHVAICSRSEDELIAVRELIESAGGQCVIGVADLTDKAQVEQFVESTLATLGSVDILVNNAGGMLETSLVAESDMDQWWRTIEVNLKGPYLMTRLLLDGLADGGKIINLSTGVALRAGNKNSAYHVAKAGLHMFTEALANELQPRRIDVNNLIPGPVATSIFDDMNKKEGGRSTPDEVLARYAGKLPLGLPEVERLKHPDEVAEMALYMATMPTGGPSGQTFSLARRPL